MSEKNNGYKVVTQKKERSRTYKVIMLVILVAFITFILTTLGMYQYFSNGSVIAKTSIFSTSDTDKIANTLEKYRDIIDKYYLGEIDEEKL